MAEAERSRCHGPARTGRAFRAAELFLSRSGGADLGTGQEIIVLPGEDFRLRRRATEKTPGEIADPDIKREDYLLGLGTKRSGDGHLKRECRAEL